MLYAISLKLKLEIAMAMSLTWLHNEHSAIYIANEMAFAHNAMIRGINSIYNQAAHVENIRNIVDFMFFVRAWAD